MLLRYDLGSDLLIWLHVPSCPESTLPRGGPPPHLLHRVGFNGNQREDGNQCMAPTARCKASYYKASDRLESSGAKDLKSKKYNAREAAKASGPPLY